MLGFWELYRTEIKKVLSGCTLCFRDYYLLGNVAINEYKRISSYSLRKFILRLHFILKKYFKLNRV